jgi:hypothetical protein
MIFPVPLIYDPGEIAFTTLKHIIHKNETSEQRINL